MYWLDTAKTPCPLRCVYCSAKGAFEHKQSFWHEEDIFSLYECPSCGSLTYDLSDIAAPIVPQQDLISPEGWMATRYYIEAGYSAHYVAMCALAALPDTAAITSRDHAFVDIGAGLGLASSFVKNVFGMTTVTVEPSYMGKLSGEKLGLEVHRAYFEDLPISLLAPLQIKPCHLHLNSVVEHLVDPFEALIGMMSRAKVETLAVIVPDGAAIDFGGPFLGALQYLAPRDHRHLPTARGIASLVERLGFGHVHVEPTHGLLTAVGAHAPVAFPSERAVTIAEQLFLEHLMRQPDPMVSSGGAARLIPFAALNRNGPLLAQMRARFPFEEDTEALLARIAARAWDGLPFHLGQSCYWLAYDALASGRLPGALALLRIVCAFGDLMAEDFPHFAMTALDYKWMALLLKAHILSLETRYADAEAPLRALLASRTDTTNGARGSHIAQAESDLRVLRQRANELRSGSTRSR